MFLMTSFEIIGTIAFAISGALIGIEKKLDLFGVVFLAVVTSVGGGIIRDISIGNTPPVAFVHANYFVISVFAALFTVMFYKTIVSLKNIITISDAIGLGIFTAIGSYTAIIHNMNQPFIVVSMGLITGIGGGILRDVFTNEIPLVFKQEIYALASMIGALGFYYTYNFMSPHISLYVCFITTVVIRILAVVYDLHLPVFKKEKAL